MCRSGILGDNKIALWLIVVECRCSSSATRLPRLFLGVNTFLLLVFVAFAAGFCWLFVSSQGIFNIAPTFFVERRAFLNFGILLLRHLFCVGGNFFSKFVDRCSFGLLAWNASWAIVVWENGLEMRASVQRKNCLRFTRPKHNCVVIRCSGIAEVERKQFLFARGELFNLYSPHSELYSTP